jgi:hypothetical protein
MIRFFHGVMRQTSEKGVFCWGDTAPGKVVGKPKELVTGQLRPRTINLQKWYQNSRGLSAKTDNLFWLAILYPLGTRMGSPQRLSFTGIDRQRQGDGEGGFMVGFAGTGGTGGSDTAIQVLQQTFD